MKRRAFLAGSLVLPMGQALAAGAKGSEFYVKLPAINVEYWDENGIFHMVVVDATAVFHEQGAKLDKSVGVKIAHALSAMTWEEFSRGNPAATVKAIALDLVRKEPGAEKAMEVLLGRLIIR